MLNPKTNVCKLRNGVLLSSCFRVVCQNHTESYIVVDSLFNAPPNISGDSLLACFVMHLFVFFLSKLTP